MPWLTNGPHGVVLALRVTPRSSRNRIDGEHGGALKIRLQAPPVEGKANAALIDFLAERLDVPVGRITLQAGAQARTKRVAVAGLSESEIRTRLKSD